MNYKRALDLIFSRFDWIVMSLLTFIILIPKFQLWAVDGTYINIRIEDFAVAFIYALWLVGVLQGRFDVFRVFQARNLVIFLGYGLIITLLGIFFFKTVDSPLIGFLHWLRRVEYFGMYFVVATTFKATRLQQYLEWFIAVGFITVVYALMQWKDLVPGVFTLSRPGELVWFSKTQFLISTFGAHYDFGSFLNIMALLSLWGFFASRQRHQKLLYVALTFVFYWLLALVYARAAYIGLMVGMAFLFVISRSWLWFLPVFELCRTFYRYFNSSFNRFDYDFTFKFLSPTPTPTPMAVAPTVAPIVATPMPAVVINTPVPTDMPTPTPEAFSLIERFNNQITEWSLLLNSVISRFQLKLDTSASYRIRAWRRAFINVHYHFVWGGGYFTNGNSTDNDYIRHIAEVGVIGLAWFLLILLDIMRTAWRYFEKYMYTSQHERFYYPCIIAVVVSMLVQALFIDIFDSSKIAFMFWALLGLFGGLYEHNKNIAK